MAKPVRTMKDFAPEELAAIEARANARAPKRPQSEDRDLNTQADAPEAEADASDAEDEAAARLADEFVSEAVIRRAVTGSLEGIAAELATLIEGTFVGLREPLSDTQRTALLPFNEQVATTTEMVHKSLARDLCYSVNRQRKWCAERYSQARADLRRLYSQYEASVDQEDRAEKLLGVIERFRVQMGVYETLFEIVNGFHEEITGSRWMEQGPQQGNDHAKRNTATGAAMQAFLGDEAAA